MSDQQNITCPSEEELAAYVEGRLTKGEHTSITEHLGNCSVCYRVFAEVAKEEAADRKKRKFFYSRGIAAVAAVAVLMILGARLLLDRSLPPSVRPLPNTAAYWIQKYGVANENASVIRARRTFERVIQVTEQSKSGEPQLLFVGGETVPIAVALPEGKIVLTAGALQICYRDVTPEQGDARLAFVIGHELAHLKNQQFLHAAAFSALERQTPPEASQEKELEADAYGLIYATMAGYDPSAVLQRQTDFITEWISQLPQKLAYEHREHPGSAERARFLRSHLEKVAKDLDFFYFGVRLYQLGRYEDAILLLSRFAEKFPAREVFNNLGLSHYQLAVRTLASCDPGLVQQAYPATVLDTQTLAGQFRSSDATPCLKNKFFQDHIHQAESYFRKAIQSDPAYTPARVNRSSAQILLQQYAEAQETLEAKSTEPTALNNQALALYHSDPTQIDSALSSLKNALQSDPDFAAALYNLAVLQKKKGLLSEAHQSWKRFLQLESSGLYAEASRKELHLKEPITAEGSAKMASPLPLGDINNKTLKILANLKKQPFTLKEFKGAFYQDEQSSALVLDDTLEVVETLPRSSTDLAAVRIEYGAPSRTLQTPSGSIYIYGNFALDIQEGRIHRMVYFE